MSLINKILKEVGLKENTPEEMFELVVKEIISLHNKKSKDYGSTFSELFDEHGDIYPIIMLQQKVKRLKNISKNSKTYCESMKDSYMDIASYCIMAIVELKKMGM